MRFDHAVDDTFDDAGGGRVVHSARGFPGYPPRLAVELFSRAREMVGRSRVGMWDPLCGAGGIVTSIGLLRPTEVRRLLATDVNPDAVQLASRNLSLVSRSGLLARRQELTERMADPEQRIDPERLRALDRLLTRDGRGDDIAVAALRANATDATDLGRLDLDGVDIAFADLPYGIQTDAVAEGAGGAVEPTEFGRAVFTAVSSALPSGAVVVLSTTERDHLRALPAATRSFKHGRRFLRLYRVG